MSFRVSILALALVSGSAFAQQSTLIEGKRLVSDGLYEQKSEDGASLVAVNAAGHRALHDRMVADRALMEKTYAVDGISATERGSLEQMDIAISKLAPSFSAKASQSDSGVCGTTAVHTSASSTGGTTASSYAAADAAGPEVATSNYAFATMGVTYDQAATTGSTPAIASGTNPRVCISVGFATVTCPTATTPEASAYAISYRYFGPACQVQ